VIGRVAVFGAASWNTMIKVPEFPPSAAGTVFPSGWHETIGSSGAGKAMNLARLGVEVTLHCLIGRDEAGARIRRGLEVAGVQVDALADPTGSARHVNLMDARGDRLSFLLHTGDPASRYDADRVEDLVRAADLVLVAIVDPARRVIPIARRLGKPVWTDLHATDGEREYERDFHEADVVFFSGERMADPRPFMERLVREGRRFVVCTRGVRGAIALTADGAWLDVPAESVAEVADTNGAGDAFLAGVAYGELRGLPLERSLRIGASVAALSVTSTELASPDLSAASVADLLPAEEAGGDSEADDEPADENRDADPQG
jgi:sugar/nucleoside kinase (ribokinase family)